MTPVALCLCPPQKWTSRSILVHLQWHHPLLPLLQRKASKCITTRTTFNSTTSGTQRHVASSNNSSSNTTRSSSNCTNSNSLPTLRICTRAAATSTATITTPLRSISRRIPLNDTSHHHHRHLICSSTNRISTGLFRQWTGGCTHTTTTSNSNNSLLLRYRRCSSRRKSRKRPNSSTLLHPPSPVAVEMTSEATVSGTTRRSSRPRTSWLTSCTSEAAAFGYENITYLGPATSGCLMSTTSSSPPLNQSAQQTSPSTPSSSLVIAEEEEEEDALDPTRNAPHTSAASDTASSGGRLRPHSTPATLCWLEKNYELCEGVCIPRNVVYFNYVDFCSKNLMQPVNAASFGKVCN